MASRSQRQKGRDGTLSTLNVAIDGLNPAKNICGIAPAHAASGSVSVLLTTIRDSMANEQDYVELGLNCADICRALDRGTNGKTLEGLSPSVCEAMNQLTTTVAEIQSEITEQSPRNPASRLLRARNDKVKIAAWRSELNRILHVFNTELAIDTHTAVSDIRRDVTNTYNIVSDIHRTMVKYQGSDSMNWSTQRSTPGELPPPAPRAFFGRDELVENIVGLAENLEPVALIGAGGIGKTSVALTVLHHHRIKERFGDNRRFIRCDQFPPSRAHFLSRLSKAIGAGVETPEDLIPLRPFLSSQEMFIILDNAESILDPQGTAAQEIYTVVDELCQFRTISICITSRITTVPRHCKRPIIPTLSREAARNIFYNIYDDGGCSDIVNDILQRLDYHALSVTLLATTASHNMWDYDRLAKEWDAHRAQVLRTDYNESLAATIELSLASPTFCGLGPNARELLGVVAFFPQGVGENNLDWLFPTVSDRKNIFDKFCVLSLTYRRNGFITMLAPIQDYLSPLDPKSSPLLCATKDHYFSRLAFKVDPTTPGFEGAQWIKSEDANVEHLLGVFTSIDPTSEDVWDACFNFMRHLYWHKPRHTTLRPKLEGLPDSHHSKPQCLFGLSWLFESVGNCVEQKRLLSHVLKLGRERGNDYQVAQTLRALSDANRQLGLREEGIQQVKEALKIHKLLGDTLQQACCLKELALLFYDDERLEDAEEAASHAINLFQGKGEEFSVCASHRTLGNIYRSKGEREKAIHHLEVALEITSHFQWRDQLFWTYFDLALLFFGEEKFEDAHAHIEQAKSHTVDNAYYMGRAMEIQASIWYRQCRLEEARAEALRALEIFENLRSANNIESCRGLLRDIEGSIANRGTSSG